MPSALEHGSTVPVSVELGTARELGPFSYRWPDGTEHFERGWEFGFTVTDHPRSVPYRVRHGIGEHVVYGRRRAHSVTWLEGAPRVEGVAADDYERSRALLSLLKDPDGRMIRRREDVPAGYDGFTIVDHAEEIRAPYTRRGLAAKIGEDDLASWALFALLRAETRTRARGPRRPPAAGLRAPGPTPGSGRIEHELAPREVREAVARELVRFEEELRGPLRRGHAGLVEGDEGADRFVRENPFAFLLAVILDQGVAYQRAWRAPLLLRERLGHLDSVRIVRDPGAVAEAIRRRPALHRFVNTTAGWVVSAARRVLEEYDGAAEAIWAEAPPADELQRRLIAFDGIAQKKAAMAVMLLWRCLDVEVTHMERCDVAVDVHVRRVFLRAGLVGRDDPSAIVQAAREAWPALPAALDGPAWEVGKRWCHPRAMDCITCRLGSVCPRLTERGDGIGGP